MNFLETPLLFGCEREELVGIITMPEPLNSDTGVLIVVGGPQYRVGSHRQFVLLARRLATTGTACMRFDYRGMGDSTGESRTFESVNADIRAAVDAFFERVKGVSRVVLWALCDGASAACLYAPTDGRVVGMVLVNPWVRTQASESKTMLKHYYRERLTDWRFWKNFVNGRVDALGSLRGLFQAVATVVSYKRAARERSAMLPARMASGLGGADVSFAVALSGRDYVAREFEQTLDRGGEWRTLVNSERCIALERLPLADHTFSSATLREAIARLSEQWISRFGEERRGDRS